MFFRRYSSPALINLEAILNEWDLGRQSGIWISIDFVFIHFPNLNLDEVKRCWKLFLVKTLWVGASRKKKNRENSTWSSYKTRFLLRQPFFLWDIGKHLTLYSETYDDGTFVPLSQAMVTQRIVMKSETTALAEISFGIAKSRQELAVRINALARNSLLPKTKSNQSELPN